MNAATLAGALGALGLLLPGAGQAGRFENGLSATLSAEYDSNPGLSATAADAVWRLSAAPAYSLNRSVGPDEWSARLGLHLERSSNESVSSDRRDPNLSLVWRHLTPTGAVGLSAGYEKASTRVTELRDTAFVAADGSRVSQSLGANWSHALDQRRNLSLNASYADVGYSGTSLNDYANLSVGATLSDAWDELTERYLRLNASRYDPQAGGGAARESDSYDVSAGIRLKRTDKLDLDLSAGMNRTVAQTSRTGWQGGLSLKYDMDARSAFAFSLGRSVAASGSGGFLESDQLSLRWNHALSDTQSVGADLSWNKSRSATTGDTRQLNLWGSRALGDLWSIRLSYGFRQRQGGGVAEASGHLLALTLSYAHPDFLDF